MSPRVLIVDDEKCIRITLRMFLQDAGYEVDLAEDGEIALQKLASANFDLVITDIIMPRMSGISLLNSINKMWPLVKVILISGDPTIKPESDDLSKSVFDYLAKPVNKDQFLATVEKAFRV